MKKSKSIRLDSEIKRIIIFIFLFLQIALFQNCSKPMSTIKIDASSASEESYKAIIETDKGYALNRSYEEGETLGLIAIAPNPSVFAPESFTWAYSNTGTDPWEEIARTESLNFDKIILADQGYYRVSILTRNAQGRGLIEKNTVFVAVNIKPAESFTFSVTLKVPQAKVEGVIDILAEVQSSIEIDRVKLFVNDVLLGGDISAPYIFSLDTSAYKGQTLRLRALAIDASGKTTSDEANLLVAEAVDATPVLNEGPSLSVTSPSNEANVKAGMVNINIDASDKDGIDFVKVYTGGTKLGQALTKPYLISIDTSPYANSQLSLRVISFDMLGNRSEIPLVINILAKESSPTPAEPNPTPAHETNPPAVVQPPIQQGNAKLLYKSDFETGTIRPKNYNPDGWSMQNYSLPGTIVQSKVVRRGKYAVRHHISLDHYDGTDPLQADNKNSSNVKLRAQLRNDNFFGMTPGKEYWVGLSIYIDDWKNETVDNKEVLLQFHNDGAASPPLNIEIDQNRFSITNRFGDLNKTNGQMPYHSEYLHQEEFNPMKGKWVDFVWRVKFSSGNDGIIQVWKNGKLILDKKGMNYPYSTNPSNMNGHCVPMLSLYKPKALKYKTTVRDRTIYYDEFRVAEGTGGYYLVDPASAK